MSLVIIGAGLPRTGTLSLKEALEILIPDGPCYHMIPFLLNGSKEDTLHWEKALSGKATEEDWINLIKRGGYRNAVDFPVSFFYEDLIRIYPDAKIVLTVRDPESWHYSIKSAILNSHDSINRFPINFLFRLKGNWSRFKIARQMSLQVPKDIGHCLKDANDSGVDASRNFLEKWNERVKDIVHKDKLLIFNVKEGWEPLCKFLDLPIPDGPFPKVNDRASIEKQIRMITYSAWGIFIAFVGMTAAIVKNYVF